MAWSAGIPASSGAAAAASAAREENSRVTARNLARGSLSSSATPSAQVSPALLADLARRAPLLPGRDTVAFVDMDSMQKRVYGRQKQGAAFGQTKIHWKSRRGSGAALSARRWWLRMTRGLILARVAGRRRGYTVAHEHSCV
jgi:hypothetical protein